MCSPVSCDERNTFVTPIEKQSAGSSQAVSRLGLSAFTARALVQPLVRKLRPCKMHVLRRKSRRVLPASESAPSPFLVAALPKLQ